MNTISTSSTDALTEILQMNPNRREFFRFSGVLARQAGGADELLSPRAVRTAIEGLIWSFSLAFGRTPPVGLMVNA
jgi:hypothetical protein